MILRILIVSVATRSNSCSMQRFFRFHCIFTQRLPSRSGRNNGVRLLCVCKIVRSCNVTVARNLSPCAEGDSCTAWHEHWDLPCTFKPSLASFQISSTNTSDTLCCTHHVLCTVLHPLVPGVFTSTLGIGVHRMHYLHRTLSGPLCERFLQPG